MPEIRNSSTVTHQESMNRKGTRSFKRFWGKTDQKGQGQENHNNRIVSLQRTPFQGTSPHLDIGRRTRREIKCNSMFQN